MRSVRRRLAPLLALPWLALAAPAAALDPLCLGDDAGFGGTGRVEVPLPQVRSGPEDEPDAGFGGTGRADDEGFGGTGIFGTITGFRSLCINGVRVRYDDTLRIEAGTRTLRARDLRVGHTVLVDAAPTDGGLAARRVALRPAVRGPITAFDLAARRLEVMGQPVQLPAEPLDGEGADLAPGQRLTVYGLLDDRGRVRATRLEPAVDARDAVVGRVRLADSRVDVGPVRVDGRTSDLLANQPVRVSGRWSAGDGVLRVENSAPALDFAPQSRALSVEAFVTERVGAEIRTPLLSIDASRAEADDIDTGARIWASGELGESVLEADDIEINPVGGGLPDPIDDDLPELDPGEIDDDDDGDLPDLPEIDDDDGLELEDIDDDDLGDFDDLDDAGDLDDVDDFDEVEEALDDIDETAPEVDDDD